MASETPATAGKCGGTIARRFGKLPGGVKFQFSNHALRTLTEREIVVEWVERTLEAPEIDSFRSE